MNLQDIVCDFEYAEKLKEFGVERESIFVHAKYYNSENYTVDHIDTAIGWGAIEKINTYTVAELGEMLPKSIGNRELNIYNLDGCWHYGYKMSGRNFDDHTFKEQRDHKEADARAKLLIWLIESGHVNVEDLNNETV